MIDIKQNRVASKVPVLYWAIMFIALLVLASCSGGHGPGQVKVGVVGPFSGPAAFYGQYMREGVDLAVSDFNSAGGISGNDISLVYEDDKCIDLGAVPAILSKLKDVDDVAGIIGPFCSSPILIASRFASDNDLVMATPGDNLGKLSSRFFSSRYLLSDEADAIAGYALAGGSKRVAILYLDSDWGKAYKNDIADFLGKNNGSLVEAESYTYDNLDVRTQLAKIKAATPDALVVIDGTSGGLFKQVKEVGFDIPLFSEWQIEKDPSAPAPSYLEGVVYFHPQETLSGDFDSRFFSRYGHAPTVASVDSYDAAMALFQGLKSCDGRGSDCVAGYISSLKDWPGAKGPLTFDRLRWAFSKTLVPKTVKNGKFVQI